MRHDKHECAEATCWWMYASWGVVDPHGVRCSHCAGCVRIRKWLSRAFSVWQLHLRAPPRRTDGGVSTSVRMRTCPVASVRVSARSMQSLVWCNAGEPVRPAGDNGTA